MAIFRAGNEIFRSAKFDTEDGDGRPKNKEEPAPPLTSSLLIFGIFRASYTLSYGPNIDSWNHMWDPHLHQQV